MRHCRCSDSTSVAVSRPSATCVIVTVTHVVTFSLASGLISLVLRLSSFLSSHPHLSCPLVPIPSSRSRSILPCQACSVLSRPSLVPAGLFSYTRFLCPWSSSLSSRTHPHLSIPLAPIPPLVPSCHFVPIPFSRAWSVLPCQAFLVVISCSVCFLVNGLSSFPSFHTHDTLSRPGPLMITYCTACKYIPM